MTPKHIRAALAHAIDVQMIEGRNLDQDELADKIAAAVMALVKPKPLVFADESDDGVLTSRETGTLYRCFPQSDNRFFAKHVTPSLYDTEAEAIAAMQAHYAAAHWGQMVLADMIGGDNG